MDEQKLKVVFLLGADNEPTRLAVEAVCALNNVEPVSAVIDIGRPGIRRHFKNFGKNIRKEGLAYAWWRAAATLRSLTDRWVDRAVVPAKELQNVLASAFPGNCFSLLDLSRRYGFKIETVRNLNGPDGVSALTAAAADLGIVVGTRILKEQVFGVPRLGCINLHKGKVPEYRGMPPGFWELYDGASTAGVTVHFVDWGLDTGDIVMASEIPILPLDTPESLLRKLHDEGPRVLAEAVTRIQGGTVERHSQERRDVRPRSKPTRAEVKILQRHLAHWRTKSDGSVLAKNLYSLFVYYSGLYFCARLLHPLFRSRACILVYHRVNNYSSDILTVCTRTFAAQLIAISKRYRKTSTAGLVNHIYNQEHITPTTIAIHFDDCYQDILLNGAPILRATGSPAAAFISSGFLDTDRTFSHDREHSPFRHPNLTASDVREWATLGFEVGAHTINHPNLRDVSLEEARIEVNQSRLHLEAVLNGVRACVPNRDAVVSLFSFPFGRPENIRPEVISAVRDAGYSAVFAAHGGFVDSKTDAYDIPRMGCSGENRPLYLLLEIEGLGPGQIISRLFANKSSQGSEEDSTSRVSRLRLLIGKLRTQ